MISTQDAHESVLDLIIVHTFLIDYESEYKYSDKCVKFEYK